LPGINEVTPFVFVIARSACDETVVVSVFELFDWVVSALSDVVEAVFEITVPPATDEPT
jgi:hypothetical protein